MNAEETTGEATPLEELHEAIQRFVTLTTDEARIVVASAVVFETLSVDDGRRIEYAVPGDVASMTGSVGLFEAGRALVLRDVIGEAGDDED